MPASFIFETNYTFEADEFIPSGQKRITHMCDSAYGSNERCHRGELFDILAVQS
jgi:hypothetical protein